MIRRLRRTGVSLLEIMLAVAIAAVPLMISLNLLYRNATQARLAGDRVVGRMVLMDLIEVLLGEDVDQLREIASDSSKLEAILQERVSNLPEFAQRPYRERVLPICKQVKLELEEDLGPSLTGLVRMTVSLQIQGGLKADLTVSQLFRPAMRTLPISLK